MFYNEFGEPCDRTGISRYGLTPALKQAEIEKVNHDAQAETHLRVHVDPAQKADQGHAQRSRTADPKRLGVSNGKSNHKAVPRRRRQGEITEIIEETR